MNLDFLLNRLKDQDFVLALPESDPRIVEAGRELLKILPNLKIISWGESITVKDLRPQDLVSERDLFEFLLKTNKEKDAHLCTENSRNPLYQAGYLLNSRVCHAVVAGAVTPTSGVIRAAIKSVGLDKTVKSLSGAFLMIRGAQKFVWTDCGVVVDPTIENMVDSAISAVHFWKTLYPSEEPVVCFLSFSTKGSASHQNVEKVNDAAKLFKTQFSEIMSDGEFQFDAAFDPMIGKRKSPESQIPGKANIFIFPNLDAGNISYKIAERLGGFQAIGPHLLGTKLPYADLSRGCSAEDIVMTALISLLRYK